MRSVWMSAAIGLAVALSAAARAQPMRPWRGGGGPGMGMSAGCPMRIPGTQVSAKDTENGAALDFTTSQADQVDRLRRQVRAAADAHNARRENLPPGPRMIPSKAVAEDVAGGARLEYTPLQGASLEGLRDRIRQHATALQAGSCPRGWEAP